MLNHYKEKALGMLDGMWVFTYYNHFSNDVIISRDRFGEKPLYYFVENKNFYFSNSIKAIQKLNKKKLYFNDSKVKKFLSFPDKTYGLDNETFFKNIYQFPKSSYLKINLKKKFDIKIKKFWKFVVKNNNKIFNISCKEIKKIKENVIRTRTRSDVSNSVLVSGGLDFKYNCFSSFKISKINGYSLVSTSPEYDERKQIKVLKS